MAQVQQALEEIGFELWLRRWSCGALFAFPLRLLLTFDCTVPVYVRDAAEDLGLFLRQKHLVFVALVLLLQGTDEGLLPTAPNVLGGSREGFPYVERVLASTDGHCLLRGGS